MKHFEIVLEGGEDKVINLKELPKDELQKMLDIALEFENYEMCAHLKKYTACYVLGELLALNLI